MTQYTLLACLACCFASPCLADERQFVTASEVQLTTDGYALSGSKVETKTDGDLASILVSNNSQLQWQSGKFGDVKIASNHISLKAKTSLSTPNKTATIKSATCVGDCKITTDSIRCTCDRIEIQADTKGQLVLSGNVKLTFGDTKLTSASCTIRISDDSPTIIGEFQVPKNGG